jgi:hypothetical protein
MTDIIASVAWHCGENWHKGDYWIDGTRYTFDSLSDGDHQEVEQDELPSFEEIDDGWKRYFEDVVETGDDSLGELLFARETKRRETWQVWFGNSIGGMVLRTGRRSGRGRWKRSGELPQSLLEYLLCEKRHINAVSHYFHSPDGDGVGTYEELCACLQSDPNTRVQRGRGPKALVTLDVVTPHTPDRIAEDARRAARRALRDARKRDKKMAELRAEHRGGDYGED